MRSSEEIGKLIFSLADQQQLTISEMARRVNVAKSTLSRYKNGQREFPVNDIGKFANVLNVSVEYLLGVGNREEKLYSQQNYPLYPPISAGAPIEIDGVTENDVEKISIPDVLMGKWAGNSEVYFTRTNGDSMNKVMPHDTLIAVKPIKLHELENNDIVVYRRHGEYAVKRFERHGDKLAFRPDSTDISFTDDVVYLDDAEDLFIEGKVIMYNVILD